MDLDVAERVVRAQAEGYVLTGVETIDAATVLLAEYDRRGVAERAHRLRADQHAERRREERAALAERDAEIARLRGVRALAEWLAEMNDPGDVDARWERRTVTLQEIIDRARRALSAAPECAVPCAACGTAPDPADEEA